jgi:choline dehydrogenase-like flavoprotein
MAASFDCGIVSTYLQRWQMPNLFVLDSSTFPDQGTVTPASMILAFHAEPRKALWIAT